MRTLISLFRRFIYKIIGFNPNKLFKEVKIINKRIFKLEKKIKHQELKLHTATLKCNFSLSKEDLWLFDNRIERMDATRSDIFKPERCDFHIDRYNFAADYVKNFNVADIACGTGYGTKILVNHGANHVIGIDIDEDAINYARKNHKVKNNEFIIGSVTSIPLESDTIDIIVSFETIEHVEEEEIIINEFKRILKSSGILILSTPNDWGILEINPHHKRSYDYESLKKLLSKNFNEIIYYNQNSGLMKKKENHGQPKGIIPTTELNKTLSEVLIAVCGNMIY
jgi:2-polyprenyl-3-methyl-5-hydroxy-6-metoxy-1,4-benzoquinol methylase